MKIKILLLPVFLLIVSCLTAQDKHFSLFTMSPLTLNPANTGAFEGTVRIGGLYRGQWYGFDGGGGYRTPSFYADSPVLALGKKKRDWLGVGASLLSDEAGTTGLQDTEFRLSAAYHRSLDKKSRSIFTIGIQGGTITRSIDRMGDFRFGDALSMGVAAAESEDFSKIFGSGGSMSQMDDPSKGSLDISAGVKLFTKVGKKSDLTLGVALDHILGAEYNLLQVTPEPGDTSGAPKLRRPLLTTIHGTFNTPLSDKLTLSPSLLAQAVEGSPLELALQAVAGYLINPEKQVRLNAGLGYRVNDAGEFLVGMNYGDFKVMASYDLTTSELRNANPGGSFELAAYYIIKIFKKPVVDPKVICPQL